MKQIDWFRRQGKKRRILILALVLLSTCICCGLIAPRRTDTSTPSLTSLPTNTAQPANTPIPPTPTATDTPAPSPTVQQDLPTATTQPANTPIPPTPTTTDTPAPIPTTIPPTATTLPTFTPTPVPALPTNTPQPQAVCDCSHDAYKCADFDTQARAQACFDYCLSIGAGDIHKLDGDNDGRVCESLP